MIESFKKHLKTDYSGASIAQQADREEIGHCPLCSKPVYENKIAFSCNGYKEGCKFALWKENKFFSAFEKKLTKANVKGLLSGKHRCLVTGNQKEKRNRYV